MLNNAPNLTYRSLGRRPYIQHCKFGSSIRRGLRNLIMSDDHLGVHWHHNSTTFHDSYKDMVVMNNLGQLVGFQPTYSNQFTIRCRRCYALMLHREIDAARSVISYADPKACKYCCAVDATLGSMVEDSFMKSSYR